MRDEPRPSLTVWREALLQRVLLAGALAGFLVLLLAIQEVTLTKRALYILVYLTTVFLAFARIGYRLRALFTLALIYLIGLSALLGWGVASDASLFFLAMILLAWLWLGERAGWIALALSLLSLLLVGLLVSFGIWKLTEIDLVVTPLSWVTYGLDLLLLSLLVSYTARTFLRHAEDLILAFQSRTVELNQARTQLEEQVAARTGELERRTQQLSAAVQVTREAAVERDVQQLIGHIVTLISRHFGYYHVGLFLLDESRRYAVLQAASSEEGRQLVERGHRLEVGAQGVVGRAAADKKAYIAQDVEVDEAYYRNPDLPRTRSEIAIPLMVRGEVIGVLDIQSEQPQAFRPDDIETLQSMTDALALAIENARLFSETQLFLNQVQVLRGEETRQAWRRFGRGWRIAYHYTPLGLRRLETLPAVNGKEGLEIPLQIHGQRIGFIRLKRKATGQPWSEQEIALAQQIATQASLALENARLLEETHSRAERERILAEITTRIRETLDLETILRRAAEETRSAFTLPEVTIQLTLTEPPSTEKMP